MTDTIWVFEAMKQNGIEPELFFIVMIGFGIMLALNEVLKTLKNKRNG